MVTPRGAQQRFLYQGMSSAQTHENRRDRAVPLRVWVFCNVANELVPPAGCPLCGSGPSAQALPNLASSAAGLQLHFFLFRS